MAINIQEILHPSDSDSIKFEKINYNFDQILANGGGPAGPKGQKGDQGQVGSTGQKGQKGEVGPIGEKGVAGSTDSPWYTVEVDTNNDGNNEISILKPKVGTDLNMPIIWLGDSGFEEDVTDGDIDTNARLNIGRDDIFENYVKLRHGIIDGINKDLVLTSTVLDGYTRFNWQNAFGSTLIEYGVNTDKITLVANSSSLNLSGNSVNINSLANTNIKLSTLGSGILDVDINAEFKGYLRLPAGTTGQRPTVPQIGMIRFNTDLDIVEAYYNNSDTPEWRELCTDCGTPVGDSIGIVGGDIVANADGSPASDTISISGGNIDASADGSPVSSAELTINGSNILTAPYNTPTTLYLNYAIAPTDVDPSSSNVSVDQAGLTITMEPSLNRIRVVTSASTLGKVYKVTVTHPNDSNVKVVWTITLINVAPTPTPTSGSGAGPTPTPTSGSGAGPTPTPTSLTPLTFTLFSQSGTSVSTGRSYTWDLSGYPQTNHVIRMGIYSTSIDYVITGTSGYDLSYDVVGAAYAAFLNNVTAAQWLAAGVYTYTQGNPPGFEPTASYDAATNRLTFNMNWQNSIGLPYTTPS